MQIDRTVKYQFDKASGIYRGAWPWEKGPCEGIRVVVDEDTPEKLFDRICQYFYELRDVDQQLKAATHLRVTFSPAGEDRTGTIRMMELRL